MGRGGLWVADNSDGKQLSCFTTYLCVPAQAEDFKSADARLLTSLLMVQDICNTASTSGKPPHIVACIQSPGAVGVGSS